MCLHFSVLMVTMILATAAIKILVKEAMELLFKPLCAEIENVAVCWVFSHVKQLE